MIIGAGTPYGSGEGNKAVAWKAMRCHLPFALNHVQRLPTNNSK